MVFIVNRILKSVIYHFLFDRKLFKEMFAFAGWSMLLAI